MVLDRLALQEPRGNTPGFLNYEALGWHAQTCDPQAAGDKALTWAQVPWHPDYLLLPATMAGSLPVSYILPFEAGNSSFDLC